MKRRSKKRTRPRPGVPRLGGASREAALFPRRQGSQQVGSSQQGPSICPPARHSSAHWALDTCVVVPHHLRALGGRAVPTQNRQLPAFTPLTRGSRSDSPSHAVRLHWAPSTWSRESVEKGQKIGPHARSSQAPRPQPHWVLTGRRERPLRPRLRPLPRSWPAPHHRQLQQLLQAAPFFPSFAAAETMPAFCLPRSFPFGRSSSTRCTEPDAVDGQCTGSDDQWQGFCQEQGTQYIGGSQWVEPGSVQSEGCPPWHPGGGPSPAGSERVQADCAPTRKRMLAWWPRPSVLILSS